MKITQEVISDLLPLYFSGEASEDTIKLIEIYFDQNPEFAEKAKATEEKIITNFVGTNAIFINILFLPPYETYICTV